MLLANSVQVHVHNLASLEVLVKEVAHAVLSLGDGRQELLFGDLSVVAVAKDFIGLFLFALGLDFGHSGLRHLAQDALFLLIEQRVEVVVIDLLLLLLRDLEAWHLHGLFLGFLVLLCFVLDGLLHHHVLENLAGHLHVCC